MIAEWAASYKVARVRQRTRADHAAFPGSCARGDISSSLEQRVDRTALQAGDGERAADRVADLVGGVDAEAAVDRGEDVADVDAVAGDVGAVRRGGAVDAAALDGAAADHDRPAPGPVVTAIVLVDARR